MRKIDFLSQSPKNFIFQKKSNKNTIGGIFTFLLIIIFLLIFFYYRVKFAFSNQYDITSFISQEKTLDANQEQKFIESEKYNPTLKLKFSLLNSQDKELSNRFFIFDYKGRLIERDQIIERKINDISLYILYICPNNITECEVDASDRDAYYKLVMQYQGFEINPQNENPVNKIPDGKFYLRYINFNPETKIGAFYRWKIKRVEDNKGLSHFLDLFKEKEDEEIKEKDIFVGGEFENFQTVLYSRTTTLNIKSTRLMMIFDVVHIGKGTNIFIYEDYKRKEKSILDIYANIFSLWITLYRLFIFLFSYLYSQSFDKYKIIDNILSKQKYNLIKNEKLKTPLFQTKDPNIEDNNKENKEQLFSGEINDIDNDEDLNNDNNILNIENKKERILPKLRFFDFIFNLCYIKNCCNIKKQKLICDCNDIILKYYSMENIIYNQIMIENFMKDYNWNNPKLNDILNNNSLLNIKNNYLI